MTEASSNQELPVPERLLIGLGAAVGAGCLPCAGHYLKKVDEAGVRREDVKEAVAVALAVRRRAAEEMAWRVRRRMGEEVAEPEHLAPALSRGLASLVGLAAAYSGNSPPLLRRSIRALREKGVSEGLLVAAAEAARRPKGMAATIADREVGVALGATDFGAEGAKACCAQPCGPDPEGQKA